MESNSTYIKTGKPAIDGLLPMIRSFLEKDTLDMNIDGKKIRGYRTPDARSVWIRDYSDMIRGFKYFESDVKSTIEHFGETQAESGRIFDYFTTFPEKLPCERENWTKYVRVPVEADVEYRFVKAAYLAWQACGDDDWIQRLLPRMEKALEYIISHRWYWDEGTGLVKRPYTIDTWDFAYTAGEHEWLQFQIDDNTYWGIMHGDNSGYYEAFRIMSFFYEHFGDSERSSFWREKAKKIKENLNRFCWNGRFYTHFYKLSEVEVQGVDESAQLSLSNPMDVNRGATSHDQAVCIIQEYLNRRATGEAFAEWYSIDPPFPDGIFGDEKLVKGAYVNGGIMPLVGGELAKAAFDHGFEEYGVDILNRYYSLIAEKGETYLWYFPDGSPSSVDTSTSPDAEPTDGWGSSAMLFALLEGLAGIEDRGKGFDKIKLSPRWPAAGVDKAEVRASYESSGRWIGYQYSKVRNKICIDVNTDSPESIFHVLLPRGSSARKVTLDGAEPEFLNTKVESSHYIDFEAEIRGRAEVEITIR